MSDTEDERTFEIESAKNGRAGCKKCKQKCLQGELRIAKIVPNPFGDGKMKNWYHVDCIFNMFEKQRATTKRIENEDDIIGFDVLSESDQKHIRGQISKINEIFGVASVSPKKTRKVAPSKRTLNNISNNKDQNTSEDNSFKTFQELVERVANHPSYLDKTAIVKTMFEKGCSGHGFLGDVEVWCRLLLPGSVKRIYNLQSKQIIKLFSRIFVEDQDSMLEHLQQGDVSDTVSHYYVQSIEYESIPKESTITIQKVDNFLEYLAKLTKEEDQINHFQKVLKVLTPADLKTIIRLIKHDLRMGAGAKHILDGVHPNAYAVYKASKDLDGVIERCFKNKKEQSADIKILTPVFPMLAEACKSVEYAMKKCPNGMFSEIKYDGERVQVHKYANEFKYFSRSLKPVMPHKVAHFKEYISKAFPHGKDLILDTEILMMDTTTGKPLPFGTLGVHKKAQFKDASVCLFVFDCIYYNGESLITKSLKERKQILSENMIEVPNHIVFSEMQEIDEPKKLATMIAKVLKLGLEGLVLKDTMGKYEPGKRHWLKVKKDYLFGGAMADSADLIVLGAWYGTGQKGGMMSVFLMGCYNSTSKNFCTVTKVHTGHDDKTLDRLQKQLKMEKISCDPDKVPIWLNCSRTMVPDFVAKDPKKQPVWEVTGAEFTQHDVHTADGISIRFPRVTKIRDDKTWETATNLEELKLLVKNSKHTDVSLLLKDYKDDDAINDLLSNNQACSKKRKSLEASSSSSDSSSVSSSPTKPKEKGAKKIKKADTSTETSIHKTEKPKRDKINTNVKSVKLQKPLMSIFEDVKAIFLPSENREIERYFIAHGGTILTSAEVKDATHIFHFAKHINMLRPEWPKTAIHLNSSWIVDSINKMKQVQPEKYTVKWKPNTIEESKDFDKICKI